MKSLWFAVFSSMLLAASISAGQEATPAPSSNTNQQAAGADQSQPAGTNRTGANSAGAISASASQAQSDKNWRIAPGSVIPVQLMKSVDAKKVKAGDEVDAKVTMDMKADSGQVIVAKDTKIIGHVTAAQARTKDQKESQLGIAFDHAQIKEGGDIALPMSIQAIIAPQGPNSGGNDNDADEAGRQPSASRGGAAPGNSGRGASPQTSMPSGAGEGESKNQSANGRQPITGETQGLVGFPNFKLASATDATKGSVVSSEKNNVKLDSGTMMLLRVNP